MLIQYKKNLNAVRHELNTALSKLNRSIFQSITLVQEWNFEDNKKKSSIYVVKSRPLYETSNQVIWSREMHLIEEMHLQRVQNCFTVFKVKCRNLWLSSRPRRHGYLDFLESCLHGPLWRCESFLLEIKTKTAFSNRTKLLRKVFYPSHQCSCMTTFKSSEWNNNF